MNTTIDMISELEQLKVLTFSKGSEIRRNDNTTPHPNYNRGMCVLRTKKVRGKVEIYIKHHGWIKTYLYPGCTHVPGDALLRWTLMALGIKKGEDMDCFIGSVSGDTLLHIALKTLLVKVKEGGRIKWHMTMMGMLNAKGLEGTVGGRL